MSVIKETLPWKQSYFSNRFQCLLSRRYCSGNKDISPTDFNVYYQCGIALETKLFPQPISMSIIKEALPKKQSYFPNRFQCLLSGRHCPRNTVISPTGFNVYYQGDIALETKLFLQPISMSIIKEALFWKQLFPQTVSMSIIKETLPTKHSYFSNGFQCLLSRRHCPGNKVISPTDYNVYYQGGIALETSYFFNRFQCLLSRRHCPRNTVISPTVFNVYFQGDIALATKLFLQSVSMSIIKETLPTKQSDFSNRFQCLLSRSHCPGNKVISPLGFNVYYQGGIALISSTGFNVYYQGDIDHETQLLSQPVSMSIIKETLLWKQIISPTGFNVYYQGDITHETQLFPQRFSMSIFKETLPWQQSYFSNRFQCLLSRRHCPRNKVISPIGFNVYYQGGIALATKLFLQSVSMSIIKETLPWKQIYFSNRFQCLLSRRHCSGNKLFLQPVSMSIFKETLPWNQSYFPNRFQCLLSR